MTTKAKVRIIKRNQRSTESKEAEPAGGKLAGDPDRELRATVSNWVREFQQQRRQSFGKRAFDNLFSAA